jgi:methylated-DNA-[protein]-cysteine S-methyltransferase
MTLARYGVYRSPLGPLTVLAGPRGVFSVNFARLPAAQVEALVTSAGLEWPGPAAHEALPLFDELDRYFDGRLRRFRAHIDHRLARGFHRRVLIELGKVGYGTVVSYGELAKRVGSPGAARAVGGAMRCNPVPLLIPCHRVTAHDGSIGGFSAGLDKKRKLLALEGIT